MKTRLHAGYACEGGRKRGFFLRKVWRLPVSHPLVVLASLALQPGGFAAHQSAAWPQRSFLTTTESL